jgi:hypothetical protein
MPTLGKPARERLPHGVRRVDDEDVRRESGHLPW